MSNKPLNISESAAVQMPMKTVASLIVIVALGTMGYFQMVERLNQHSTRLELMESDLEKNTEFRIKWPRGEMGSLPADSEQFMMLEDLYKQVDKINKQLDSMMNNRINIEFLRGQMDKVLTDIEALKDNKGHLDYPYTSHIKGKIRELRVGFGRKKYRLFYFIIHQKIIVLHIFLKKTQKTPRSEIKKAEETYHAVLNNKQLYE